MDKLSKEEFNKKIIEKAWKDPQFKEKLLKDPKKMIQEYIKSEYDEDFVIPDTWNCRVIEEHPNEWILLLPSSPVNSRKLSDSTLESIGGGSGGCGGCYISLTTIPI